MTELDAFDARLTRAYRSYLEEAPTSVDAVAVATAAVAGARQRRVLVWPWQTAGGRALAWLVVLGLLVALAAAALYVGARPAVLVGACPQGSHPDLAGPTDHARPPFAYVQPIAFDSRAGRIIANGILANAGETWTFDVCTNEWTAMSPTIQGAPVNLQRPSALVYDADSDRTITIASGRVYAYDLAANKWLRLGETPALGNSPQLAYDQVSGLVVVASMDGATLQMWTYNVDTDRWAHIEATGAPMRLQRPIMAYDRAIQRIVVYDVVWQSAGTWLFDPRTGEWTTSAATTPVMGFDWTTTGQELAYDAASGQIMAFSGGLVAAYDGSADEWRVVVDAREAGACDNLTCIGRPSIVYDSFNRRIVVLGSEYATADSWYRADGVLAFDLATGQWTTLLAPTGQKVPN